MAKNYQVSIKAYSLNELTKTLVKFQYGDKVKASSKWVVPAFSNLVNKDPNTKGVTWAFEYKSQADNLVNRLNYILKRIKN